MRSGLRLGAIGLSCVLAGPVLGQDFDEQVAHALQFSRQQLQTFAQTGKYTSYPGYTKSDGTWNLSGASEWTSGFFPGALWLTYESTADSRWRTWAESWTKGLEGQKTNTGTHDVGFIIFTSFGNGYRITRNETYRAVILQAAKSLSTRYSSKVGCVKSWNWSSSDFPVIVDNMMNLEILFWASRNGGDRALYDIAVSHALKTMQNHVRADGSTYHVVNYDPATGAIKEKTTRQGAGAESTWARGQAWAVYGFTMAYRETGDVRFLETAQAVADYFLGHLPADHVPYWDFEAPGIPNEERDSSAAAIAASGLLELSTLVGDAGAATGYLDAARTMLASLASPAYLAEGTSTRSVLLHGCKNHPGGSAVNNGLVYGDYYFVEALQRYQALATPPGSTVTVTAADPAASESGPDPGTFTIRRTGDTGGALTVGFSMAGTATPGVDYGALGTSVTFAPGDSSLTLALTPIDDVLVEGTETAVPTLQDGPDYAVGSPGSATISISDNDGGTQKVILKPTADAYVRGGTSAGANYSTATILDVKNGSGEDNDRWAYFRFELAGLSATSASSAVFKLHVNSLPNGTPAPVKVFSVAADTWTETGITWTSRPAAGSALASASLATAGATATFDVTPFVSSQLAGDKVATLCVQDDTQASRMARFDSRESAYSPVLEVTEATGPPANRPPVAQDQSVTTRQDTPVGVTLAATDPDGDSLTFAVVTPPAHGELDGAPPGLTYTPGPGYGGTDTFTFEARDGLAASNVATVSITVAPNVALVAFASARSSNAESVTPVGLPVTLSAAMGQTVMVSYAVTGGTAAGEGADYSLADGILVFDPGVTSRTIPISVVDDALVEPDETIVVTLSSPVNAVLGATTVHTFTIVDNDTSTPRTVAFNPAADAHVRGGTSAGANFGTATTLEVKNGSGDEYDRQAYLRFDLGELVAGSALKATLRLFVDSLPNGTPVPLAVLAVTNDSWTETGVTWSNRPATGSVLATASLAAAGTTVTFDVTPFVSAELGGDKIVTLAVVDATQANRMAKVRSRESTANKPLLEVTVSSGAGGALAGLER